MNLPTWCPECGPKVDINEDGCCVTCGASATGRGAVTAHLAIIERDEARAEVLEYREQLRKLPDANRIASQDAYRRGAEAMRKRCEELVKHNSHEDGIGMGSQRIESAIRALPIPEEP